MRDIIQDMMKRGVPERDIRASLVQAGWSDKDVNAEISSWVMTPQGPVPKPDHKVKNALHGVSFILILTFIAMNLVALLFLLTEVFLPDPASLYTGPHWRFGLAWPTANLFVLCPLFLCLRRKLMPVPGWAMSLSSFVIYAVLIGDAVTAMHGLLSGNGDAAFFIKCTIVGLVSLLVRRAVSKGRHHDA